LTTAEWRAEVNAALAATNWRTTWCGIVHASPRCLAELCNGVTGETKEIGVSRVVFPTPTTRIAEIRRQVDLPGVSVDALSEKKAPRTHRVSSTRSKQ
jgi:hypothetical protein